jgi:hypothetical protein
LVATRKEGGMNVVGIDPGVHEFYYAILIEDELRCCGKSLTMNIERLCASPTFSLGPNSHVIIEKPTRTWKGKQSHIIDVGVSVGIIQQFFRERRHVFCLGDMETISPTKWKGSTPKRIDNPRTLRLLSSVELLAFADGKRGISPSARHNLIDAIGIALWRVGRKLK